MPCTLLRPSASMRGSHWRLAGSKSNSQRARSASCVSARRCQPSATASASKHRSWPRPSSTRTDDTPRAASPSMASGGTPCSTGTPARRSDHIMPRPRSASRGVPAESPARPSPRRRAKCRAPRQRRHRPSQVLRGHQVQQRPAAEEDGARADRAGLRLQRDLRRAQAVAAGALPARHRHQPVGRAGADDQRVERQRDRRAVAHDVQLVGRDVPGQRVAAVVDVLAQRVEAAVQRLAPSRPRCHRAWRRNA